MQRSARQRNRTRKDSKEPQLPPPAHLVAFHSYQSTPRALLLAIQLPHPQEKANAPLGTRRVQRALYGPPCMDQGAHGPAGDFPPPGALCKLGGAGRAPPCSMEPWEPQRLPFDMGRSEGALGLSVMLQRAAAAGSQAPCSAQLLWDLIPSSCHL